MLALALALCACERAPSASSTPNAAQTAASATVAAKPRASPPSARDPARALPALRFPLAADLVSIQHDLDISADSPVAQAALALEFQGFLKSREARCGGVGAGVTDDARRIECLAALDAEQARVFGHRLLAQRLHAPPLAALPPPFRVSAFADEARLRAVQFSDDRRLVAALWNKGERYADGGVSLFNHGDGRLLANITLPFRPVCAAFSANGRVLLVTSHPDAEGQLRRLTALDTASGNVLVQEDGVTGEFRLLPDDRLVTLSTSVLVFDLLEGRRIASAAPGFSEYQLSVTKSGQIVTSNGRKLTRWQLKATQDGQALQAIASETLNFGKKGDSVVALRHSVDGRMILVASSRGALMVLDPLALRVQRTLYLRGMTSVGSPMPDVAGGWYAQGVDFNGTHEVLLWDPVAMRGALRPALASSSFIYTQSLRTLAEHMALLDEYAAPGANRALPLADMAEEESEIAPDLSMTRTLKHAATDASVELISVYEGSPIDTNRDGQPDPVPPHTALPVEVAIGSTDKPVVLVLASYEPVAWQFRGNTARITQLLMSGSQESTVNGLGRVEMSRLGDAAYNSERPDMMAEAVRQQVGRAPDRAQNEYAGAYFTIGRGAPRRTLPTIKHEDSLTIINSDTGEQLKLKRNINGHMQLAPATGSASSAWSSPAPTRLENIHRKVNERGVVEFSDKPVR